MLTQFTSFFWKKIWLGRQGSNLRITGSKPVALPLGYAPIIKNFSTIFAQCPCQLIQASANRLLYAKHDAPTTLSSRYQILPENLAT